MMVDGKLELRAVRSSLKLEAVEGQTLSNFEIRRKYATTNPQPAAATAKTSQQSRWRLE